MKPEEKILTDIHLARANPLMRDEAMTNPMREVLEQAKKCIRDLGEGKGGWAWEEVIQDIDAALSAPVDHSEAIIAADEKLNGPALSAVPAPVSENMENCVALTGADESAVPQRLPRSPAFWTHDEKFAHEHGEHLYYFAPLARALPPYREQRHVNAIVDIAADGTLAGVELISNMPPPPATKAVEEIPSLEAAPSQRGSPEWRPIETAPKTGERLLGFVAGQVRAITWGKTSHIPLYGWVLVDQGAEDCDLCQPTHWMPLPAPPSANDDHPSAEKE